VAWQQTRSHPLLGDGAGSFEQYWYRHRPLGGVVQDAHSLYLETLAEVGPVGLVLLALLLIVPLAAAVRARRHPLVPAAAAALTAFAVHAAADWDWELAGVTLTGILLGAACVLARRELEETEPPSLGVGTRSVAVTTLAVLAAVALIGLLGNVAAGQSDRAAKNDDWQASERYARQAIRWMPWSSVGWRELGEAQLVQGDTHAARHSLRKAIEKDPRNWVLWLDLAAAEQGPARRTALRAVQRLNPLEPAIRQLEGE
jgi:cytochrome c-type biogenesis protein CcmH/NrfG